MSTATGLNESDISSGQISRLRLVVLTLAKERRRPMIGLAVSSVLGGLVEALFLVLITQTALSITGPGNAVEFAGVELAVRAALGVSVLLVLVRGVLAMLANVQGANLNANVTADLRADIAHAYLKSSYGVQHEKRSGQLQELLTTFTAEGSTLITGITGTMTAGFSLVALLASALVVSPLASGVVILVVAVLGLTLRPIRQAVRRESASAAQTGMDFASALSEISDLGLEMHVFNVQTPIRRHIDRLIASNRSAAKRVAVFQGSLAVAYSMLSYLAVIVGLAVLTLFDSGSLFEVGAAMLVMLRSLTYGQSIQKNSGRIHAALPFLDALQYELDRYRAAERTDRGEPVIAVGEMHLANVSFEYDPDVPVLTGIGATIREREVVGIIGPSGSGKSTLVQLLLGLRSPTGGVVTAAGRDIAHLSQTEWARHVTFVPQQSHLVQGSIADNIRFYREWVTDEDIVRAAKRANLHRDVITSDAGYDRQVGHQGGNLSGGQQQRLIIARALVEQPDLLILDEPTSALDVRSEGLIRDTLEQLRESCSIIIIAHRMSTLDICDRLMVVQDGAIKAFDTPTNLEEASEFYREAITLSGLH